MACCKRLAGGYHLYIYPQTLGEQLCKYYAGNTQKAKIQDGCNTCFVYITFEQFVLM